MLTAVDSVLMVIDSVKGVESQTKKLLEVCRLRHTPIMTFINKLDREGRDPLDLLDDIENNLRHTDRPDDLADRDGQALPRHLPPLYEGNDLFRSGSG